MKCLVDKIEVALVIPDEPESTFEFRAGVYWEPKVRDGGVDGSIDRGWEERSIGFVIAA
jgi:hypothetical protein